MVSPFVVVSDERIAATQTRQVDVVFHQHDVTNSVVWIQATSSVCDDHGFDAHQLHHTNGERDLKEQNIVICAVLKITVMVCIGSYICQTSDVWTLMALGTLEVM